MSLPLRIRRRPDRPAGVRARHLPAYVYGMAVGYADALTDAGEDPAVIARLRAETTAPPQWASARSELAHIRGYAAGYGLVRTAVA